MWYLLHSYWSSLVIVGGTNLSFKLLINKIGLFTFLIIEKEFQGFLLINVIKNLNGFKIGIRLIIISVILVNVFCKITPDI